MGIGSGADLERNKLLVAAGLDTGKGYSGADLEQLTDRLIPVFYDMTQDKIVGPAEDLAGQPGPQGKSAYEVAVANGYVGTPLQWLASLIGPQGGQGQQGIQGPAGLGVPSGGTVNQYLKKNSSSNNDTSWGTINGLVPAGGVSGQALRKASSVDYHMSFQNVLELPSGGSDTQILGRSGGVPVWRTAPREVPAGGTTAQTLRKNSNTEGDYSWVTPAAATGPGSIVGEVFLDNASPQAMSTTVNSWSPVNAALFCEFVAPTTSLNYMMSAVYAAQNGAQGVWGVINASNVLYTGVNGQTAKNRVHAFSVDISTMVQGKITGLIVGTLYKFIWGHAVVNNGNSGFTQYGGSGISGFGPATMRFTVPL